MRNPTPNRRERALPHHAFQAVSALANASQPVQERYANLARRLPSLLQSAGLGQAVAFLLGKAGSDPQSADGRLLSHMADWLLRGTNRDPRGQAGRELMQAILDADPGDYRRMSRDAATLADWLKRFAEGLL